MGILPVRGKTRTTHRRTPLAAFVIFTELPKTSTGKIQKHVLREEARAL